MQAHLVPAFPAIEAIGAAVIALIFILLSSLLKEPNRQNLMAIILAGAGAAYLNGALGVWEFAFCALITFIAFKGLKQYYFIGIGWLLHAAWDIVHHLYGNPIVPLDPSSSAGCAVCDSIWAVWFFYGAPNVFDWFKGKKVIN